MVVMVGSVVFRGSSGVGNGGGGGISVLNDMF